MDKYIAVGLFIICTSASIILRGIIVRRHWRRLEERFKMSTEEVFRQIEEDNKDR